MSQSNGDEKSCIIDTLTSERNEENEITNKMTVQKLMSDLAERDRTIINMRYFQAHTQMQVAEKLGISQVQVSRIEKKILLQMRESLTIL